MATTLTVQFFGAENPGRYLDGSDRHPVLGSNWDWKHPSTGWNDAGGQNIDFSRSVRTFDSRKEAQRVRKFILQNGGRANPV